MDSETSNNAERSTVPLRVKLVPSIVDHNRRALLLLSIRDAGDRAPLAQEIFDEIAIAIVEGRLRPGDVLNSVDLARRFGTSRTPVREALAELERQGTVVIPPRRRPYIAQLTLKQIKDVYDLRASLNTLVSELIIEKSPTEGLKELWTWYEALEKDVAEKKVDEYFWHNVGFRLVEARIAGNDELQKILASFGLRTLQFRHLSLSLPGRLQRSLEDHRRLLVAYEESDTQTAVATTRSLIMLGYRAIEQSGLVLTEPTIVEEDL
ncbi:MAG: GntR family transcriptional regulator [Acidimicrobiaceae bacterium]|nr:GntR family transcriptional regulator [Acidimicrobiaceae bacterium]